MPVSPALRLRQRFTRSRSPSLRWAILSLGVAAVVVAVCASSLLLAGCDTAAEAVAAGSTTTRSSGMDPVTPETDPTSATGQAHQRISAQDAGAGLFDSSVIHEITVTFAEDDYLAMVETYSDTAQKDWIEATVTIDGVTYDKVGMRLKGNSSLRGLRGGGPGGGPAGAPAGRGLGGPATGPAGGFAAGGSAASSSADEPERLPWLIRLDKYIAGQNHEGIFDLVVRSNNSVTALNEAVSLELLELAGLASQEAISVRFSVNGSAPVLRLVIEHPDDVWMEERFDGEGALYKAESTGDYSYRGDDPDAYDEVFDQEAGETNADLTPLIEFLEFINNSDEKTFNSELGEHLDIDSFATYLAMQNLLANFDDIDGPGNNSYLYYDPVSGMFTVVPWDHNLAFRALGGEQGTPSGEGIIVRPQGEEGNSGGGQVPGGELPGGEAPRDRLRDGAGNGQPAYPGDGTGGQGAAPERRGPVAGHNILVERFLANPEFEELYQQELVSLRQELYESGVASDILAEWVTLLVTQASDLVGQSIVKQEAARIATFFEAAQ